MSLSATALLAVDRALPQRDVLLESRLAADRLERLIGGGRGTIAGCDRLRVNYQIGKSLRVVYGVEMDGSTVTISARASRDGRGQRIYAEARAAQPSGNGKASVLYDAEIDTVFWVFPSDRKIHGLAAAANGELSRRAGLPISWQTSRLIAYAPEKSATLACVGSDGTIVAYAKVAATNQAAHDYVRYRTLEREVESNPHLRLPRALAYVADHFVTFVEAIDGRRLNDATGPNAVEDAARFGAALATFHGLRMPEAPPFTRFAPDRLLDGRRLIVAVRPDVEQPADALVADLISARPVDLGPPVCLHGDVHPKNAIVTDREIALIDAEDLAVGPAAADLGSFLASLVYLRRGGRLSAGQHAAVARAFLHGYGSIRPLPAAEPLTWHTAAALLVERILRAVTRVRPLGLCHLADLIGDAHDLLSEGEPV